MTEFIDLKTQYLQNKETINARINNVLEHGKFILGPEVYELEESLCDFLGITNTITCANGTDALVLALKALDIGENDIVFCPTFTYFASAESISLVGATPIFVDSELDSFNMCPIDLEKKIKFALDHIDGNLRAVMTVDLFGLPANYPVISSIARNHNLKIIEDGAQGFGGTINNQKACTFGDISTTSFFPAKPLGCYGDGGAVFTNNDDYAEKIRSLRQHGKGKDKYDNERVGMNSRLDSIQAAILLEKLKIFPVETEIKQKYAEIYTKLFKERFIVPSIKEGFTSSWAQFTLRVDSREKIQEFFAQNGIPTMIYYKKCMHQQNAYNEIENISKDNPNAELLSSSVLSIPMHAYLNDDYFEKLHKMMS